MEIFRLDREQRYVALTNHMWSGFNLMANLALWQKLPVDIRTVIENCAHDAITAQRVEQASFNIAVRDRFEQRGLIFNDVDQAPFRRQLSPIYEQWRAKLGATAWAILEREVGRLD